MTKDSTSLDDLKKKYHELHKKYSLPSFEVVNELFDIEEVESESDFLLRTIRRSISEKVSNYFHFVEVLLNPNNAPLYFYKLINRLETDDRTLLLHLYEKLGTIEVQTLLLDLSYSEKNEAAFIIQISELFSKEIKNSLSSYIKKITISEEVSAKHIRNGSYFG